MDSEYRYLISRLQELDIAADRLTKITTDNSSVFFKDAVLVRNLEKVLIESAAVRRKLTEKENNLKEEGVINVWRAN